jgi:predicted lysophospholipase L1 biosynthesis ABC-type transport system permease subunit
MLQREVLLPVVLGAATGVGLAFAAARALASLLHDTSPGDLPTFLTVATLLVLGSFAASLLPALRILRCDLVQSMRGESSLGG